MTKLSPAQLLTPPISAIKQLLNEHNVQWNWTQVDALHVAATLPPILFLDVVVQSPTMTADVSLQSLAKTNIYGIF